MSETYDLFQQGRAHLRKGRAAQATVALEKAKLREPNKASIREALGIAYLRIQRYEEAEEEFRAMLELSPADLYTPAMLKVLEDDFRRLPELLGRVIEAPPARTPVAVAAAPVLVAAEPAVQLGLF